jgi:pteridine reductase
MINKLKNKAKIMSKVIKLPLPQTGQPVAIVTGAARRIGAEIATYLHSQGFNVVIHYRHSQAAAAALAAELNEIRGHSAIHLQANLTDTQGLAGFIEKAANYWGKINLLVNNASSFYPTSLGQVTETQWDDLHASNVKGAFFLSQAAIPYLKLQQGSIINITDIHAHQPLGNYAVYCIAKAGLVMMTKALAKELAPAIRVNAIAPGGIAWPEAENQLDSHQKQKIIDKTLLKRHGNPIDIAKAVYYMWNAEFVTGQILAVDGGRF